MTTAFPTGLDNFTNPTPANNLSTSTVLHTDQHSNSNDAVEALEAKVGVDSSAVTSSLDYRVTQLENQGGGSLLLSNTVTLNNSQILTLPTTPFVIVPAPGAGKANLIINALVISNLTIPYTNIDTDGNYIGIDYGNDIFEPTSLVVNDVGSGSSDLSALLDGTGAIFQLYPIHPPTPLLTWTNRPVALGAIDNITNIVNAPLYLFCYNGSGDFTGGNIANTLKVTIFYVVVTL